MAPDHAFTATLNADPWDSCARGALRAVGLTPAAGAHSWVASSGSRGALSAGIRGGTALARGGRAAGGDTVGQLHQEFLRGLSRGRHRAYRSPCSFSIWGRFASSAPRVSRPMANEHRDATGVGVPVVVFQLEVRPVFSWCHAGGSWRPSRARSVDAGVCRCVWCQGLLGCRPHRQQLRRPGTGSSVQECSRCSRMGRRRPVPEQREGHSHPPMVLTNHMRSIP
jgi:hypothetical protein